MHTPTLRVSGVLRVPPCLLPARRRSNMTLDALLPRFAALLLAPHSYCRLHVTVATLKLPGPTFLGRPRIEGLRLVSEFFIIRIVRDRHNAMSLLQKGQSSLESANCLRKQLGLSTRGLFTSV